MAKFALGQKVFVLSRDGEVVQTMVGRLEKDEAVFLNGYTSRGRHWTSFEQAADAAREVLEARRHALRKALRQLAVKAHRLGSEAYKESVVTAPYKMIDMSDNIARFCSRKRKRIAIPADYIRPGTTVYVIITPHIMPRSVDWVYRPHQHFVLETQVRGVYMTTDGQPVYSFVTPFKPSEYFLDREEAEAQLSSYSEPGQWRECRSSR